MDYEFWFWIAVAFFVGRLMPRTVYIGPDEGKYRAADMGILTKGK